MSKAPPRWDGRSRPSNAVYKKRWEEIFGKKKEPKKDKPKNNKQKTDV